MQSFMCTIKMSSVINDFHVAHSDDWSCCICTLLTCISDEGMLLKAYIESFRIKGMSVFLNNYVSCSYCMISLKSKFSYLYCMISFKFSEHYVVNAAAFTSAEECNKISENWLLINRTRNWFSGWEQATQKLSFQGLLKNAWKMSLLKKK